MQPKRMSDLSLGPLLCVRTRFLAIWLGVKGTQRTSDKRHRRSGSLSLRVFVEHAGSTGTGMADPAGALLKGRVNPAAGGGWIKQDDSTRSARMRGLSPGGCLCLTGCALLWQAWRARWRC